MSDNMNDPEAAKSPDSESPGVTGEGKAADLEAAASAAPELEEMEARLLRALAEAENVRKRSERQIQEARQYAVEALARDLLPVSDNLIRALDVVQGQDRESLPENEARLLEGVEMTCKELHKALDRHGIESIKTDPGMVFDPTKHQAVSRISSVFPEGTIADIFQSGWQLKGRVLRAAMVAVSSGAAAQNADHEPAAGAKSKPGGAVNIEV